MMICPLLEAAFISGKHDCTTTAPGTYSTYSACLREQCAWWLRHDDVEACAITEIACQMIGAAKVLLRER